jgi:hypothetical protein
MIWFAPGPGRLWIRSLFVLGIAASLFLTACGGQEKAPSKSTEGVSTDDLPSLVLAVDDLPEDLAGFTVTEAKAVSNEAKAKAGGDEAENLARFNSWGRQGGYSVTFTREEQGGVSTDIEVELHLVETETGAHAYFADWFVGDNPLSPLGIGDESHRSSFGMSFKLPTGDIEETAIASAYFRTGRIIGSVSVSTSGEKESEAEDTARELARLLFDKIQERL